VLLCTEGTFKRKLRVIPIISALNLTLLDWLVVDWAFATIVIISGGILT
jgi:hypothetical protein